MAELTHGEKVGVVYDSVGQSTWQASLNSLKRRGLMVSFGNASGPVTGVDLALLNQKGSLYVTRPSLNGYITNRAELQYASNELFSLIGSGAIRVEVKDEQKFALADAQRAHPSAGKPRHQRLQPADPLIAAKKRAPYGALSVTAFCRGRAESARDRGLLQQHEFWLSLTVMKSVASLHRQTS